MATDLDPPGSPLRVVVAFGSPMMLRGCAAILDGHPEIHVIRAGDFDMISHTDADDIDVAVVGMVGDADAGGKAARQLVDRGVHVLVVLPPGVSGEAAASVGASGFVAGATVDEVELISAVLAAADPSDRDRERNMLSARERAVLAEVARGATDREIGDRLGISMRTVQSHLDRIRAKTGRRRRAELTRLAFEIGVTPGFTERQV